MAYNDEPPEGFGLSGAKFGHCKGVLCWSKSRIGWLVHSVPAWPPALSNEALPPIVSSGLRCGQSFVWLSLPRSEELTRRICGALRAGGRGAGGR